MCFNSLCAMWDIIKTHDFVLPREAALAMLHHCEGFLISYNWLTHLSIRNGRLNYNFVSKCHYLWHIAYHARFLKPKASWCFEFEGFVGEVLTSAKACMADSSLHIVGPKVLQIFC